MTMYMSTDDNKPCFHGPLLHYVRKGSFEALKSFIQNEDPDATDYSGSTLLHYAAESNNVSMTKHFLECNYNIDVFDDLGNTPLMLAVQCRSIDTAKLLIEAGAKMYYRDWEDKSILPDRPRNPYDGLGEDHNLRKKFRRLVKIILERVRKDCWHDEQLMISRLKELDCTLIKAMYLRDANVTRIMLNNGFSVNEREVDTDDTPLHKAVKHGDFENVKVLLEHGADVSALNTRGHPPINFYTRMTNKKEERLKILTILIEYRALLYNGSSCRVLSSGNLSEIKVMIKCDDFEWDTDQWLFSLVMRRDAYVFEAFRGINLDLDSPRDSDNSPVISLAAMIGHSKQVQFLLEFGADPNIVNKYGHTSLTSTFRTMLGIQKGHLPIVIMMLQHGANAKYTFPDGRTVFDIAWEYNSEELLKPVIAHLAMEESLGKHITDPIQRAIDSNEGFKSEYTNCQQILEGMKCSIINEGVTLYKLLTESQAKINGYARNSELANNFATEMKTRRHLGPYYTISLRKRVGKAINLANLRKDAVAVLNEIFKSRIKNYYEILYEMVSYLNCNDLKNVCQVLDFGDSESFYLDRLFS